MKCHFHADCGDFEFFAEEVMLTGLTVSVGAASRASKR